MKEPPMVRDLNQLQPYLIDRVKRILNRMEARGFDPVVVETRRTLARQTWLYGVGRWHSRNRKPVTQTMLSKHLVGKAVDIASRSHGWRSKAFFDALKQEANREGMARPFDDWDQAHIEWRGGAL